MQIYNAPEEAQRLQASFDFVRTLVTVLQEPNSFDFEFQELSMISILNAPDRTFKIFSWHVPLTDGSFLYYGAIQKNTEDGQLRLIPLLDKTFEIEDPETTISKTEQWYGAQYSEIIALGPHYLLLGWKGHTPEISQKVIEVLTFQNDEVFLGAQIFDNLESNARVIFQFSSQLSMHLAFEPAQNRIVFDHLVPSDERFIGDFAHYGPDLTFDAWKINGRSLEKLENVKFGQF